MNNILVICPYSSCSRKDKKMKLSDYMHHECLDKMQECPQQCGDYLLSLGDALDHYSICDNTNDSHFLSSDQV